VDDSRRRDHSRAGVDEARPTAVDVAQRHAHAIGAMLDPNDLAAELNAARGE
jgi:hypothetical protein